MSSIHKRIPKSTKLFDDIDNDETGLQIDTRNDDISTNDRRSDDVDERDDTTVNLFEGKEEVSFSSPSPIIRTGIKCIVTIATVLNFLGGNSTIKAPEAKETIVAQSTQLSFHTAKSDDIASVRCGNLKCFVIMENNSNGTTNRGYVIAQENRTKSGEEMGLMKSKLDDAWIIASHIHHKYNLSTLLLQPAEMISKDVQFVDSLNKKLIHQRVPTRKMQGFNAIIPITVQQSLVIPEPNFFWHYQYSVDIKKLLNVESIYTDFVQTHVQDYDQFKETLQKDINATKQMLIDSDSPCLLNDFQLMIDFKGRIHHIDLDRCFDEQPKRLDKDTIIRFIDTLGVRYASAVDKLRHR